MKDDKTAGVANPDPRRSSRVPLNVEVILRRAGQNKYVANVQDLSRHGCKLELVDRPRIDERVWVKIEGLEPLEARVCWLDGFALGVEFQKDLHPAVFDHLVSRLDGS